ncbi:Nsun6 [Phodopus roborovskii]|uniref:Nsun6 protein n=1 Tax=Phodopus roborovskii TaxID=109678 RepID=A0AAV0A583_PHORO|nr:Nsun6 [Phodopus roborovskii]
MPIFPKISLRPEVENYLKESFMNKEVVSASSKQEAERKFEALLIHLAHPPSFTTVRVNTHLASVDYVRGLLLDELQKQFSGFSVPVLQHPALPDVLLIPVTGPSFSFWLCHYVILLLLSLIFCFLFSPQM